MTKTKLINAEKLKIRLVALWEEENVDGNTDLISFFKVEEAIDKLIEETKKWQKKNY